MECEELIESKYMYRFTAKNNHIKPCYIPSFSTSIHIVQLLNTESFSTNNHKELKNKSAHLKYHKNGVQTLS